MKEDNEEIHYPWSYIVTSIKRFQETYRDIMEAEGWNIVGDSLHDSEGSIHSIFVVISTKTNPFIQKQLNDNAYAIAREYGWIVNYWGLIRNYKEELQTRNKHASTSKELGLL